MTPAPDFGEESYTGHGRLQGKAALITGGDSGIGRAVALAFAREGADVLISYLNEHSDAEETARVVRAAGRKAVTVPGDISEQQQCRTLVERAVSEFGRLDILVNNAAYQMTREGIESISAEELEHTFKTNILAMFYLCQAAWPHFQPGSAVINTASIQAYQPSPQLLGLRDHQGRHRRVHQGAGRGGPREGDQGQLRGPWPGLDAADPGHDAGREGAVVRSGLADRAPRPAGGAGPDLRFPRLEESSYIAGEVVGVTGGKPLA
jgi:hypothetical protein